MDYRIATDTDLSLLAEWNHQLIRDEGHRNSMNLAELQERMRGFLQGEYTAVIFTEGEEAVAYGLYRESVDEIYLRQFFVKRERRRKGLGREAIQLLLEKIWPKNKRLTLEVLTSNATGIEFWRSLGYKDYCLTLEIMPTQHSKP